MDSAQRFLDDEIAAHRDQLRAAEKRRAELARQYPEIVSGHAPDAPDASGDSRSRLDQARAAVARAKNDLEDATTKRDSLRQEIATVPQMLTVDRTPQVVVTGGRSLSPDETRLEQMRSNLDTLRLKYTDQHPDVVAAREAIGQLEGEIRHSGGSGAAIGSGKAQVPNTIYDQLKVKLVHAEGQVAATQRRLADAQLDQDRIEQIAKSAPSVITEAEDLDRDYGILKRNYQELVSRREATLIADAADTKTEKIQFRIVDPPQVPVIPAEPNRPLLVSIVLLAGLVAGIATPIVMAQLDRSFATLTQLRDLGIPVLGSVTRLSLGPARRQATIQLAGVCASAGVLIAVYGTLLALSLGLHSVGVS
jgi:polysaccharide chain length determinant protein (PEP-CTERM system associated)